MRPPALLARRRRALLAALALAALASLLVTAVAFGDALTPESGGSKNADEIDSLYKLILWIAAVVFLIVEGALFYSLFKFRAKRSKGRVAAQIHGNTRLEIGWTVAAAAILVVLTVVTFVKLDGIQNPPNSDANVPPTVFSASTNLPKTPSGKSLKVCVVGRQYIWRYTYSSDCNDTFGKVYSYTEMVVPAGTTVVLDIESTDVAHSWWIPKLGGKFDAIPGSTNYTWFKAEHAGVTYTGQCAELCGRNHADMLATVRVVTPQEWQTWVSDQKNYIQQANKQVQQLGVDLKKSGDL